MSHTLTVIITPLYIVIITTLVTKKYSSVFMLLVSDMMILLLSAVFGDGSIMGNKTTENAITDVFAYATSAFKSNVSGVGLTLMMVTRYAVYMSHIGASTKLAYLAAKPLSKTKSPYIALGIPFITGTPLKLVITSHANLAMLLMAIAPPALTSLGISKLNAATVMIMCGFVDWGPNNPSAVFATENTVEAPMMSYSLTYQEKAVAILVLICAALPPTYLRHMGKKGTSTRNVAAKTKMPRDSSCPACYTVFLIVPLTLIAIFGFIPSIRINVVTTNPPELFFVFILELVRRKDRKEVISDSNVVVKATGNSLTDVVSVLIGATVFAEAIRLLDDITIISNALTPVKSAPIIATILMSVITFFVGMLPGLSNASWYAFGPLIPDVAAQIGISTATITLPIQLPSGIGRCMSPMTGAVIAIPDMVELEIMGIIKRYSVLAVVMLVRNMIVSYVIA